jgi:uncharacterized protein (DUF934 family)
LEEAPEILAELASVQMHAIQTSGNCVRNITTEQFAGVAHDELLDPRPLAAIKAVDVQAVWISPDDDFESCMPQLKNMQLIAVDFPSFRDGRGYSIATLLRTRYGWTGELRAIGDVLRDQLNYMRRCGFDSFAVRADKDIHDALLSFSRYSVRYQGAVDDPVPLFRRRTGQPR